MGCGCSMNRRVAAQKMGEDQDAGSPPSAHPAPTAPESATKEEKKAPLSEHHILPETPAPSSLSDDSPSKPKPTLAPEQPTPPPLEGEGGDGLVGGRGNGFGGGGSGVEVPGTCLDGVRRDVEKGSLGGRGERSESAKRRMEEPGGLALTRVEPQVRLPRLGGEPLPQLKAAHRGSSDRASSGEGTPLETKKRNGGFEGEPAGSESALADVGSRERLAATAKDGAEPAKRVKTDATNPEERVPTPAEPDTTRLTYEEITEEREARDRHQRRLRAGGSAAGGSAAGGLAAGASAAGASAAPGESKRKTPDRERASDRGEGEPPPRQEARPALSAGAGAAARDKEGGQEEALQLVDISNEEGEEEEEEEMVVVPSNQDRKAAASSPDTESWGQSRPLDSLLDEDEEDFMDSLLMDA